MATNLPPKLEAVLIRLCRGRSLNVTQAVKLPYLVDVVAMNLLGRKITEGTHLRWDHGVVTSEVWHHLDKCIPLSHFRLEPVPCSEERKVVVIDDRDFSETLTPDEEEIVDFVGDEYASVKAVRLGEMTKLMNPTATGWGTNQPADLDAEAYERMDPGYQRMAERLITIRTLEQLRRLSVPVRDLKDLIA